jgi:pSer/pThr/pTyr-binding forkhead associated (FHA) protein
MVWEKRDMTIGRHEENDIVLPHRETSRYHACLSRHQDGFYICDQQSTNGTFVNGVFLHGRLRLCDHDHITIADTVIIFRLAPEQKRTDEFPQALPPYGAHAGAESSPT